MSNYEVRYDVQVTTGNSVSALRQFEQAVAPLNATASILNTLSNKVNMFNKAVGKITSKPITINMNIAPGLEAKLDAIIAKLRTIKSEGRSALGSNIGSGPRTAPRAQAAPRGTGSNGTFYRAFGATPFMGSNVAAIDFLKGMGVAYSIAGAGQLVSSIVKQSAEYDNTIQTTKNILKAHDERKDFSNRFREMESVIRRVGIETKFTAPEVADASKFLAMAGLKVEDIKTAIRPIADIALIGDTDLGETADVVTNIMTAYRKPSSQMREIADVLTNTFTMSNTTLMEMAEAYKYSAALLSAGDVAFEESAGALGVLGDAGIKGSQAGTTMRTIMANIVNPTKKQKEAWAAYGISRDGSLLDIFRQLHEKDLPVKAFYQMFHKTAAQGAVALAESVEKWADIYKENLFSDDMSKQQADAKKNTLQGLWASLVSAFVDDGMGAFSEIQDTLRAYIKMGISWLQEPGTKEKFKEYGRELVGFINLLRDALGYMVNLFKKFGWAIKIYLKFQLVLWPVLNGIKAVAGLINGLKLAVHLPAMASGWLGSFGLGTGKLMPGGGRITGARGKSPYYFDGQHTWREKLGMWFTGGMLPMRDYFGRSWVGRKLSAKEIADIRKKNEISLGPHYMGNHNALEKAVNATTERDVKRQEKLLEQRAHDKLRPWQKKYFAMRMANVTGNLAMGAAGAWATAAATDYSPTGIMLGSIPAIGGALSIGGWGGPIAAGIALLIASGGALFRQNQLIDEACEAWDRYNAKIKTFKGLSVGAEDSPLNTALEMAYNKNLSINELLEKQYEYYKKINDLKDGKTSLDSDEGVDLTGYKQIIDFYNGEKGVRNALAPDHVYTAGLKAIVDSENKLWGDKKSPLETFQNPLIGYDGVSLIRYQDSLSGKLVTLKDPDGGGTRTDMAAIIHASHTAAQQEYGKIERDITERVKHLFYNGMPETGVKELLDDFNSKYSKDALKKAMLYDFSDTKGYDFDMLKEGDGKWVKHSLPFLNYIYTHLYDEEGIYQQRLKYIQQYMDIKNSGGKVDLETALGYWGAMDPALSQNDLKMYVPGDWFATMKNYGYDAAKGVISLTNDVNKMTYDRISNMLKFFPNLPPELQSAMAQWKAQWDKVIYFFRASTYDAQMDGAAPLPDPTKQAYYTGIYGMNFRHDPASNTWVEGWNMLDPTDSPDKHYKLEPQVFGQLLQQHKNGLEAFSNLGPDGTKTTSDSHQWGGGADLGGDSVKYKNHYKDNAGAPKQVIINIDNLMNVESVDLSKPDNQAAVNNIKEQLAQALMDVVHDFSISAGHLG